jgi:urate oxidase
LKASVTSGLKDLLVLKSTGSSFTNFVRDEYTLLAEVDDRIFSTSIDLKYTFEDFELPVPSDERKLGFVVPKVIEGGIWDEDVFERAREVTCEIFATDDSASVQVCTLINHVVVY